MNVVVSDEHSYLRVILGWRQLFFAEDDCVIALMFRCVSGDGQLTEASAHQVADAHLREGESPRDNEWVT